MSSNGSLDSILLRRTSFLNLKLWVVFCICIGGFIFVILVFMILWVTSRTKSRKKVLEKFPQIPDVPKDIAVDIIEAHEFVPRNCKERDRSTTFGKQATKEPEIWKQVVTSRSSETDNMSQGSSVYRCDRARNSCSEEERILEVSRKPCSSEGVMSASPLVGLPEVSQVGWGHWFTLRDLELATNRFSKDNVIGEGGYGVVYRGRLANGTDVAVKKILNNMGQAEKEFKVEVEAIGNVRHKNLVRLLGYCIEGVNRLLVYEYVNNGNLEQWLHGAIYQKGCLSWENRMKIAVGTAKA